MSSRICADVQKTPLTVELARLELQDLTLPYQGLAESLHPLTRTLPITLLNLEPIMSEFTTFFARFKNGESNADAGLDSALFLLQALYETCLGETTACVPATVKSLVHVGALRKLEPKLVERTYSTLSIVLRTMTPHLLKLENAPVLRAAWTEVRPYLDPRGNKPYVRKCIADAWAGTLRKARGEGLQRLMATLLEEPTPGMEAVWANSMKGASHHLHSRGLPIFTVLLDELAASPSAEQIDTLRLVVTALVHHCSSSQTGLLVEAVLSRVDLVDTKAASSSKQKHAANFETSTAFLDILSAFLYTRKGKRFPAAQLKPTMIKLQGLIPHIKDLASVSPTVPASDKEERSRWRQSLVAAIIGSLYAGHLAEWLSPGVTMIDALWNALPTSEAFAFVNMCVAFKWLGIEQFLLAHIAKTALGSLVSEPLPTLVVLNNLASAGYLSGGLLNVQGGRWRSSLVNALVSLLRQLGDSSLETTDRRILGQVLRLLPYLAGESASFVEYLYQLINRFLKQSSAEFPAGWRSDGAWNDTHIVGRVLHALYQITLRSSAAAQEGIRAFVVQDNVLPTIIRQWHWSREILEQSSLFVEHWPEVTLDAADVEALYPNVMSADSSLRLSSLKILTRYSQTVSEQAADIWTLCKTVETAEMSLRNVRERTSHIARLGRHLVAVPADAGGEVVETVKHAIRYLVAQLKVNFRPVWAETVTTVTTLTGKYSEDIWAVVWGELEKTVSTDQMVVPDLGVENPEWTRQKMVEEAEVEYEEEDMEFRCTGLAKGRTVVSRAWQENNDVSNLDVAEIQPQISRDRLDVLSYESQLLAVLTATPSMAEKHTRLVIPVALAIAGVPDEESLVVLSHLSTRKLQDRTIAFLELLAKFVNPKAAFRSAELHALYLDLLSKGEPKVQGVALRCLMTYKSPALLPYRERLSGLLEDSRFRDELTHLDMGPDSEVIEPTHRPEFIAVAIRLLYGIMMSRRARSSTAQGQGPRKQAILSALTGCSPDELATLVDLMLEPLGGFKDVEIKSISDQKIVAPGRQQLGYLTFLHDVLRYLAPQTSEHWPRLLSATVALVNQAQLGIDAENAKPEEEETEETDEPEEVDERGAAPLRTIRSTGLKRVVQFLRSNNVNFDFTPYLEVFFSAIISPRLALLEVENTQAPSGTLDLIAALAASPDTAKSLVQYDDRTLSKVFACMTAVKVKPAVISRVFDVVDSLLIDDEPEMTQVVLMPNVRPLINNIIGLVENLRASANEDVMRRLLGILSRLSTVVTDGQQAQQLATLLGPMLRQPGKQVPEKAKINILVTLQRLYTISPSFQDSTSTFFSQNYNVISNLFQTLYFSSSRKALVGALQVFGGADPSLAPSIELVADMNAYHTKRMDEPDFDKRLAAFAKLNDAEEAELPQTAREWLPILRSTLHFIQEPEEYSIRSNASSVLQRFVNQVGSAEEGPLVDSLVTVVLPALRRILLSKVELVRNEVLLVLSQAVKTCTGIPVLAEMATLLGDEDETNIFVNFSHIQVHRRARAIRRLRDLVAESDIRETSLQTIFLPVLQHILSGATDVTDHHLVNEAIITIGALAGQLSWSRYNALINHYLRLGTPPSKQQRFYIRAVTAIIDNFHFDLKSGAQVGVVEVENVEEAEETEKLDVVAEVSPTEKITNVVLARLIPTLAKFIGEKSDTEDTVRIPVALALVKIASQLPDESSADEILRTVTTTCQILRSKDQDIRDIARDTIGKIAVFLGPEWLVKVLKELRAALQRGPQKHTLAVTVHSILVHATTDAADRFSNLDEAVSDAVEVAAEVIWGESGKDVATEGFKTKMREVRGALSRGNDTFQLVSRLVSPSKIAAVLEPVRGIMSISQAVKTMQQVDEVLRRVALGLNGNALIGPEDILSLCHALINGNSSYLRPKRKAPKAAAKVTDRFHVQMKRNVKEDEDVYPQNAYKFVTFGLDLFVTAFRRGKFDFDDVNILARLGPLVNAIGNTLYSPESGILTLGLKATAAVAKCPVPQVDEALPAFVTSIFKIIKNAGGTAESEVAQTALKTLAVLIRDCKATQISDSQLRYLLEVVGPDIEDHERQSSIFTVLRAIVARRFVVPEIYDLMDRVSSIMVTSQSTHVQELSRGVLMQFLLDYPQGKNRLKSQMTFLARNLDYVFEAGRMSVMEVLSAVFNKFSNDVIADYADMFFVALVAVLANDDSEKCRNMAGALLQQLYGVLDEPQQTAKLSVLKAWVGAREDNPALAGAALAVFGLLCESAATEELSSELSGLVVPVLATTAKNLAIAETSDMELELDHTLPHAALSVTAKALKARPEISTTLPWNNIIALLLFPHEWVRFGAARALATLFGCGQLALVEHQLYDIARKSCILLGETTGADGMPVVVDAKLADQLVKLLYNIAKHWAAAEVETGLAKSQRPANLEEEEEDEDEKPIETSDRPLAWVMSRMSFLARRLIIHRPAANELGDMAWTGPIMSILRFFAGTTESLTKAQARSFLVHMCAPLTRILDENGDLASVEGVEDLKTLATEVREFIQAKVGSTAFSKTWEMLRKQSGAKRDERREKRARMAVVDPKAWAQRQERRGEKKKESKKRKTHAFM